MFRVIDARDLTQGTSLRIVNTFYLISFLLSRNATSYSKAAENSLSKVLSTRVEICKISKFALDRHESQIVKAKHA